MLVRSPEIPYIKIGVIQARSDQQVREAEQERWTRALATTPGVDVRTEFFDATDPRGIRKGMSVEEFVAQQDGWGLAGTSEIDEHHRDLATPAGRLRRQYHAEVDPIVREGIQAGNPFYGACYGAHEIIVALFGENAVDYHPDLEEFGTHAFVATPDGQKDPLLDGMPKAFGMLSGHKGSIIPTEIPQDAITVLGKTRRTPISAFRIKDTYVYGVQGHAKAHKSYVRQVAADFEMLAGSELRPYTLTAPITPPYRRAGQMLGNFGTIVHKAAMNK